MMISSQLLNTDDRISKNVCDDLLMNTQAIQRFPPCDTFSEHPSLMNKIVRHPEVPTCRYLIRGGNHTSSPRPIRRSKQECARIRLEGTKTVAAENEYTLATWRMYDRIMKYRQNYPLPDSYYNENNEQDTIETSLTGTTSASSSPSLSPNFLALPLARHEMHNESDLYALPFIASNIQNDIERDLDLDDSDAEIMIFQLEL
jgi:hypothetical protein